MGVNNMTVHDAHRLGLGAVLLSAKGDADAVNELICGRHYSNEDGQALAIALVQAQRALAEQAAAFMGLTVIQVMETMTSIAAVES